MTNRPNPKKRLRDVLNLRLDDDLSREIQRIAASNGSSESEAARQLMQYGIAVQRQLEAHDLQRPYNAKDSAAFRYADITAKWTVVEEDQLP